MTLISFVTTSITACKRHVAGHDPYWTRPATHLCPVAARVDAEMTVAMTKLAMKVGMGKGGGRTTMRKDLIRQCQARGKSGKPHLSRIYTPEINPDSRTAPEHKTTTNFGNDTSSDQSHTRVTQSRAIPGSRLLSGNLNSEFRQSGRLQ